MNRRAFLASPLALLGLETKPRAGVMLFTIPGVYLGRYIESGTVWYYIQDPDSGSTEGWIRESTASLTSWTPI